MISFSMILNPDLHGLMILISIDHSNVYVMHILSAFHYVMNILKGTYYENNTFPGIWAVVLDLWCSHTHTQLEKSLYMIG